MEIKTLQIAALTPDPNNARRHDSKNLDAIAGSLEQFGQRKPIVITSAGLIIAGNGTVAAAKKLGWETIEAVTVPDDWTPDQAKAYALADNRTAELAEWDQETMAAQLVELDAVGYDIASFGFEALPFPEDTPTIVEDEIPETAPGRVALGDVWQLGRHRLMCGDATKIIDAEKLMANNKADLVFTDPPYGVGYQSNKRVKSKKFEILINDDTLLDIAGPIQQFANGWVFVWTSWKVVNLWVEKLAPFGYPTNMVIWNKGGGGIGDLEKTFFTDFEIALVWHNEKKLTNRRIGSVWSINKDAPSVYQHPTQKPVALAAMAIEHTTQAHNLILDLFGGSGSTLIAAEQTNRTCYMMELDPKYCDVIIQRWENLTGEKAQLVNG